jgi:hypothetical protein
MAYDNDNIQVPAADQTTQIEETLQIEELESRIAPSAVWGD